MMTVVLKVRSQTTQELGRNANYLAPLRPTDSEIPGVGQVMFQAAMREGGHDARCGAVLSPSFSLTAEAPSSCPLRIGTR